MCGFVGFANMKNNIDTTENMHILISMNESLSKRGPDEEGYYSNENICLAHKRLIVIDPEGR